MRCCYEINSVWNGFGMFGNLSIHHSSFLDKFLFTSAGCFELSGDHNRLNSKVRILFNDFLKSYGVSKFLSHYEIRSALPSSSHYLFSTISFILSTSALHFLIQLFFLAPRHLGLASPHKPELRKGLKWELTQPSLWSPSRADQHRSAFLRTQVSQDRWVFPR